MTRTVNWLALVTLSIFLTGCATQPGTIVTDAAWEQHRDTLAALKDFKADGKIAVRSSERSDSASMVWVQQGTASYVNLSGPLGTGATNMRSDGETVTITSGGETRSYDIDSVESLPDWGIPIGTIRYWAMGIPDPALAIDEQSVEGNLLRSLTQSGWAISYSRYDHFGRFTLPTRMQLVKGDSKLSIIMYDWSIPVPE